MLLPHVRAITLTGALVGLAACPSEGPPPPLFNEDGVWSLVEYDIGDGLDELPAPRKDAFLLKFNHAKKVVTTAACTSEENNARTPADSPCRLTPTTTEWTCRCFAYAFQEEIMQWQEFPPGSAMPPKVTFDPDLSNAGQVDAGGESGGSGSGSGGGGEGGAITVITTSEIPDTMDTFDFRPLPPMVFGADLTSHFIFEQRAVTLFDQAYMDDEGRKAYCQPCLTGMP